jgi:hypothetical protein
VHHKLEELLDEYLKATGLGNEPGSLVSCRFGQNRKAFAPSAGACRRRGHAQTTAQASGVAGALFTSLAPSDRHHKFYGKRRHPGGRSHLLTSQRAS